MNKLVQLEKWYTDNYGDTTQLDMITSLIPKGKTLMYGKSGSGKTYSTIKHLNDNNITPLLIDFDNNKKVDNLKFNFVGGVNFIDKFNNAIDGKDDEEYIILEHDLSETILAIEDELDEMYQEYKSHMTPIEQTSVKLTNSLKSKFIAKNEMLQYLINNRDKKTLDIENYKPSLKDNMFLVTDSVIIIDTFANAMITFEKLKNFEIFVNRLLKLNNSVVVIAHTKLVGTKEYADIDDIFANHCDCKLHLNRDFTKTKGDEQYLFVEKLRGYKGSTIIKNWMMDKKEAKPIKPKKATASDVLKILKVNKKIRQKDLTEIVGSYKEAVAELRLKGDAKVYQKDGSWWVELLEPETIEYEMVDIAGF